MQSREKARAIDKVDYFRRCLYDYIGKCLRWYARECPSDVADDIKETYDGLIELYNLLANVRLREEWKVNPISFYDIVVAYYKQVWLPYKVEWDLTDDEVNLANQFEAIFLEGEKEGIFNGYEK